MDHRQISRFILVASIAFLAMTLLQPVLFPPPPKPNPPAAAEQDQNGKTAEQDKGALAEQDNSAEQKSDAPAPAAPDIKVADTEPNRLVALGSVAADSQDKLLVTLDSKGGAIRRVELNARFPNGKLRYYDQETRGAYLGFLDLTPDPRGCEVHFVGPGTPAAIAGLQVGDILTAMDGKPVVTPDDFAAQIDRARIGTDVTLSYLRGSGDSAVEGTCTVKLVPKPLEVIGPIQNGVGTNGPVTNQSYDPQSTRPSSFLVTLRKKDVAAGTWPELDEQLAHVNWKTQELEYDGSRVIEFSHEIPATVLAAHGLTGPLQIIKRYWLPKPTALDDFEKNFHVNLQVEVRNLSDKPVPATMEIAGPTGTNIEGWWYQNKIHGRSSAIFYVAGARDIVGGSKNDGFQFMGNAEIVENYLSRTPKGQPILVASATPNVLNFICVDTLYFAAALIPDEGSPPGPSATPPTAPFQPYSAFPHVVDFPAQIRQNRSLRRTTDLTFRLFSDEFTVPAVNPNDAAANAYRQTFLLFTGPKEPALLRKYNVADRDNLAEVVTYGWFAAFSKPLVLLLRFFYSLVHNYGIAIIMLTVIVRLLLMPISRRVAMNAQTSAKMMQALQPEIKKLTEKYKDDMEKRMRAQQELFAKHGFNPLKQQFGGCLLVFLQLPIFIGLYRGLSVDVALRGQPLIPGLQWCSDLAAPDQLLYWKDWMPGFLANETSWFGPYLNLLPLITIVLFLIQTKLFMPPPTDEQQKVAQRMMTFMMVFMSVLFFKVPSGLCLYFITSSIWGMVERAFLPKSKPMPGTAAAAAASGDPSPPRNVQRVGQK